MQQRGGFFSWGGMSEGIGSACSAMTDTCYEFGVGIFNGFTSPVDTIGSWINGGLNETSGRPLSAATRLGEVCGVIALGVSFYTGGVAIATGTWATGQLCVQGARIAARRAFSHIGRRMISDAVAEVTGPAVLGVLFLL